MNINNTNLAYAIIGWKQFVFMLKAAKNICVIGYNLYSSNDNAWKFNRHSDRLWNIHNHDPCSLDYASFTSDAPSHRQFTGSTMSGNWFFFGKEIRWELFLTFGIPGIMATFIGSICP